MSVVGSGSAGPGLCGTDVITMDGSMDPRPPGGRGATRPVRAADGRRGASGVPGPWAAGAGGEGADVALVADGGLAVPDGGSVAAGAVWGALVAACDDEALSVAALVQRAGASRVEVEQALERFEAAALVLRVPRGRRAGAGWMLAGGVREGLGTAQVPSVANGCGHGPALPGTAAPTIGVVPDGSGQPVLQVDPPVDQAPAVGPVLKPPRLAKGELEAKVLTALRAHHPQEFGPLSLSREIGGYSSGAVSNALERLHVKGRILRTCEAPKRYAALPPEAADGEVRQAAA